MEMVENEASQLINKEISIPLYSQIKTLILQSISLGEFKINEKIPSEMELAKKYGVSRITTKQALIELMKEGYVYRVPGKGTFVKQLTPKTNVINSETAAIVSSAREGISGERSVIQPDNKRVATSCMVGLILPYINDSFLTGIIVGIEKVLRNSAYHLLFRKSDNRIDEETRAIEALRNENVQGLIILPADGVYCSNAILKLKLDQFPFVLIDRFFRGIDTNCILSDNYGGAYEAGKYLVRLGHRAIGLIGYPAENAITVDERVRGFSRALADNGLSLPSYRMLLTLDHNHTYDLNTGEFDEMALDIIKGFLKNNPDITAVFGINDFIATCISKAAMQMGLKVPGDLSIIGFDNNSLAPNLEIPLTTVNQPKEELGEKAAQILQQVLEKGIQETRKVILPTQLIIRASTAPPKG